MWAMTPRLAHVAPNLFAVTPPTWGELGVYAAAVLTLLGVIYTATATRRTGREANAVNQLPLLWGRIKDLEERETARSEEDRAKDDRMDELEDSQRRTDQKLTETLEVLSIALEFIGDLFKWGRGGGGEPEPTIPAKLREWLAHIIHREES